MGQLLVEELLFLSNLIYITNKNVYENIRGKI